MIDTVKLVLSLSKPLRRSTFPFQPSLDSIREDYNGYFKAVLNTSASDKRNGTYRPRLTYTQRAFNMHELVIELSLPKLLYGNNFSEVSEKDFTAVIKALMESLKSLGIGITPYQLRHAEVRKIDFCKNIIFTDYTSVSSVVRNVQSSDITRVYDIQNTNFRNGGHVFHIHTNTLDVALYDKIADLRQAKISDKRAIEDSNHTQLSILNDLENKKPISVARFEVRLNGKPKIRNELIRVGIECKKIDFESLFKTDVSRTVMLNHWQGIFDKIPKTPLDSDTPEKIFREILKENGMKPRQAFATLGYVLLIKDREPRYIRNLTDQRFGRHAWSRLKDLRSPPDRSQLKSLIAISKVIETMEPVDISRLSV